MVKKKKENWHTACIQSACLPGHYLAAAEVGYAFANRLCRPVIEIGMTFVTVSLGIPVSDGCSFKQRNKNFILGFDLARCQPPCNFRKRNEEVL